MFKKYSILFLMVLVLKPAFTQNSDETILQVGNEKVTVDEFLHIYNKNNTKTQEEGYNLDSLQSYMDLFIDFKLKVTEAKNMGLDTLKSFKKELKGYRNQLAEPYLRDKEIEKELIREAYKRKKEDRNVSHILIKVDPDAAPEDTLKAYNKIKDIKEKLNNGKNFREMAVKYSEDKSVDQNKGDLGWFTVFKMVYPFESAAYNTPVGEISDVFRSRFGYHIVKVNDKRPAKGRRRVAHIMTLIPREASKQKIKEAEVKINIVKEKLERGVGFKELARDFSEDKRSARKGGLLPWFEVGGKMIPKFENAAYKLDTIGEISDIIKTSYGYHIIKLIDKEEVGSFEEEKSKLKGMVNGRDRGSKAKDVLVTELMKEYNGKVFNDNYEELAKNVTDSIFEGKWDPSEELKMTKPLIKLGDTVVAQKHFAEYLKQFNKKSVPSDLRQFLKDKFKEFKNKMVLNYEKKMLKHKNPRFRYLLKEYHDGILLFDVTDKMVWSKAVEDSAGLREYYKKHKKEYMWDTRFKTRVLKTKNQNIAENLKKYLRKNDVKKYNEIDSIFNNKDSSAVEKEIWGTFETGKNRKVSKIIDTEYPELRKNKESVFEIKEDKVISIEKLKPQPKKLNEARGLVTADYQNYLEKKWLEKLYNKYTIIVNEDLLKKIASN